MLRSTTSSLALGLGAGLVSGLFGVGGGIIIVPGLVLLMGFDQHRASGTSMATIIASASAAIVPFARDGAVDWRAAALIAIGAVAGAAIGARILHRIPDMMLRRSFAVLLLITATRMLLS